VALATAEPERVHELIAEDNGVQERRFGEITVRLTGGQDREGGGDGPLVVLMHGFGAPGTDLVGLWRALDVPQVVRFAFPEAPNDIPGMFGARAWWMLDMRMAEKALAEGPRSYADEVPPGMEAATDQIVTMLGQLQTALGVPNERLIIGGFSQGSMAACNAAFTRDVEPAGLIILSGTPVHLSAWRAGMSRRPNLRVLQSHGERDALLSFEAAKELRDAMRAAGLQTEWIPFRGGHEIPLQVLDALAGFLRDLASAA
jgi:phospholipase/carboxylesterase